MFIENWSRICQMTDFSEWLQAEMDRHHWNQTEFSQKSGLDSGFISNVLSETKKPGPEFCRKAAKALGVPQYIAFFHAGLITELPDDSEPKNERTKDIARRAEGLSEERLAMLEQYVAFLEQGEAKVKREPAKKVSASSGARR